MDANAFRHLYEYHFHENRALWERYIAQLTPEQFSQEQPYSLGSIGNHLVHMIAVDQAWFSGLSGAEMSKWPEPTDFANRDEIRAYGEEVAQMMRAYLATLTDEMLFTRPLDDEEDKQLFLWQVLLQVVNHGTDHRAQVLRLVHDLGVKTWPQDYVFYAYGHPVAGQE